MTHSDNKRLFWFNTLFDLELSGEDLSRHLEAEAGLSAAALLCCRPGDAAVLDAGVDPSYPEWLSFHGFHPEIAGAGADYSAFEPVPWGWSRRAEQLFDSFGCSTIRPSYVSVMSANSRELSNEAAMKAGSPSAGIRAGSAAELQAVIAEMPYPFVVKPCFGSAGSGFTVVTDSALSQRAVERSRPYFAKGIPVSVEPWLDRIADYAVNFTVADGKSISPFCHRSYVDKKGIFRGIDIGGDIPADITSALIRTADISADLLGSAGYFGPAGIDAFTYRDNEAIRFNPICEINARLTMGFAARSLYRTLGGSVGRTAVCVTGGVALPENMESCARIFSADRYDRSAKRGIFPATPPLLRRNGELVAPRRMIFYIAGSSSDECDALEEKMRMSLSQLRRKRDA